ncbi:MAG: bacterio-opsin activator [candidate division WOR-3 bacterium]
MVITLKTLEDDKKEFENLVGRVFFKSIDLLGGLRKLTEYRTLTWLPSLARASYAIVLREEYLKTEDEIARAIGLTRNTVRSILRADPNLALQKIDKIEELAREEFRELKVHTAGGIAKLAYKMVKDGNDAETLLHYCSTLATDLIKTLDIPWAYLVLKNTRGIDYPINESAPLIERLRGLRIKGVPAEEILDKLQFPIQNPAVLLREIKNILDNRQE